MDMKLDLLGGLTPRAFLARYWQKQPLLVRGAVRGFRGAASRHALFSLSQRDDVESRLVARKRGRWSLRHGPFERRDLAAMPRRDWTLLVQGVNEFIPEADALMRRFAFVPYARLDDVMASYAVPGGGVGPHFDSYDVFLLQGFGRRRWRVSAQTDRRFDARAPLRILTHFRPEAEWVLEPGDMLYLPPGYAHDGVALDECTTWSIGFRAADATELAREFLNFLADRIELSGTYADPGLAPPRHPAAIDDTMIDRIAAMLDRIAWRRTDIERFVGEYLSEPKARVVFDPPRRPLGPGRFAAAVRRHGLTLDARTLLLFRGPWIYANGERHAMPRAARSALVALCDRRRLEAASASVAAGLPLLYSWYRAGYLHAGPPP
ncbi:MAG: cupin domain-containing protein [Burkholderiales bacterium]|nr:cupin domain-containing protein [Burkholderiales bacterium]